MTPTEEIRGLIDYGVKIIRVDMKKIPKEWQLNVLWTLDHHGFKKTREDDGLIIYEKGGKKCD